MGGDGSGRRPDPVKHLQDTSTAIGDLGNGDGLFIPNYSGVSKHIPTLADLDKRYQPLGSAGAEQDPIFIANSGSFLTSYTETDPIFIATSSAFVLDASANYQTLTDGSNADLLHTHTGLGSETDPIFIATSGSFLKSYTETDPIFINASGSFVKMSMSGAWNTHVADNSQAHSDYLINNGNDTTTGSLATTSDFDASGAGIFRNIIIDTTSGGYTASNFTQGSILLVYN